MVIVITGPTCVGKTKMSIELAKRLNGEVINADSTQVYIGLSIATAKVTEEEMDNVPHHLIDIKKIDEEYSVYDYQKDCREAIDDILSRGKVPIMVGGTGLYIKAALYNYDFIEYKKNNYDNLSLDELYSKVVSLDKNNKVHKNNRKRLETALNYMENTNKTFSSKEKSDELIYDTLFIGLTTDRNILYDRINKRVDDMLNIGLIDEAYNLYKSNIRSKAVMTPIGYKELFPYFENKVSLEEALDKIRQDSRRYAKRQYTWNKNQMNINQPQLQYLECFEFYHL